MAVVIVILARPRAKGSSTLTSKKVQGSEIVVAMDISNSMLASSTNDADGISRLQRAKFIVEKLFDRMTNDKVGLVVFAGDAYVQMPITNDFSSAKMFLNSLSTNMVSNQGTDGIGVSGLLQRCNARGLGQAGHSPRLARRLHFG